MSFLSGWLRVGQDGCWLAGPWAGLLAGWLLGGLLLAGRLGGWLAGLWSRLGWLSWSGLGWLAAAGGRAGWLQRLTGKRPATGGQPPGGQSVACRARKIEMLHPFGNPHLGRIKWKSTSTPTISKQDHKSKSDRNSRRRFIFKARGVMSSGLVRKSVATGVPVQCLLDRLRRALKMKRALEFLPALALMIFSGNPWRFNLISSLFLPRMDSQRGVAFPPCGAFQT